MAKCATDSLPNQAALVRTANDYHIANIKFQRGLCPVFAFVALSSRAMSYDVDTIVIGAGAAGLAAAAALAHEGVNVAIVEARDRVGGRISTLHDSVTSAAVELGAEFVHGRPPEIWNIVSAEGIGITEVAGEDWSVQDGRLAPMGQFSDLEAILSEMNDRGNDQSFVDFLERCCPETSAEAKARAKAYVTGFHAADPAQISVHSLVHGLRADEKIDGDRAFRLSGGYQSLLNYFREALARAGVPIHLNTVVENVRWQKGGAELKVRQNNERSTLSSQRVLVTLPLGVLQSTPETGVVDFSPRLPSEKQSALEHLAMGKVIRVTLRFETRFWNDIRPDPTSTKTLAGMRFLFSQEEWFPTWWTTLPAALPLITAWAPFHAAERLAGKPESFVVQKAHESLARVLKVELQRLSSLHRAAYWHDWESDPFSCGAYSYVKVGGDEAQQELGRPLQNTLFFAGEATDVSGHNGTVHGAIASGYRAANEILKSSR